MKLSDLSQSQMDELIRAVSERVAARLSPDEGASSGSPPQAKPVSPGSCPMYSKGACGGCGQCVSKNPAAVSSIIESGANRIGSSAPAGNAREIAPFIDHTLLKPNATDKEVETLCREAGEYGFASVCINSAYVPLAGRLLTGSNVKVCTVVGFPLGAMSMEAKAFETRDAVANGADEIDMVINVGKLKSGEYDFVFRDIEAVVRAAQGRCVKVILETASLTDEEKVAGCILSKAAGAWFVKTSTGFGSGGATSHDVALMRKTVGPEMGVKASGGIKTTEQAREMLAAGATRIGASASVAIVRGKA